MKVLINKDNVVVAKAKDIKKINNGFLIEEQKIIFADDGLKIIETKLNPKINEDKIVNDTIVPNPDFKTKEEIKKLIKEKELKQLLDRKIITKEEYEKIFN